MKGRHLRKLAHTLLKQFPNKFGEDFEANQNALRELKILKYSREELNKLAGELCAIARRLGVQTQASAPQALAYITPTK